MPRSSERGAVRRRSSLSMIRGSRGLRQNTVCGGLRVPAGARRVTARNRGAGAAPGRTATVAGSRPDPALSAFYGHIPLSPNLLLSPAVTSGGAFYLLSAWAARRSEPDPGRGTGRRRSTFLRCPVQVPGGRCPATDVPRCGSGGVSRRWAAHLPSGRIQAPAHRPAGRSLAA
jgi:hypothetical protein